MTQTARPSADLRECHLYRFWVRHPVTGKRVLGYIGETWQMPFDRLMQHVRDQPWADTILGWEVDPTVYYGKQAVLDAERRAVEKEKPLYNHEWNLANPHRVEIWRAKEQRWARDDAAGKRRWVPPAKTPRQRATRLAPVQGDAVTRRWTPAQVKVGLWSAAWALSTLAVWAFQHRYGLASGWPRVGYAAGSSAAMLVWAILRPRDTWALWMKRARTVGRVLRRTVRWIARKLP